MQTSQSAANVAACVKGRPTKASIHVNFDISSSEMNGRKKNYLTAKYGQQQMNLIKKRLRVEMWMCEELQQLYTKPDGTEGPEIEIDLDELLDIEGDGKKKEWLRNILKDAEKPQEQVEKFIDEVLEKAKTL